MSLPSQVSVIDVAAVGDVLDTFPVCASPIYCIASVPEFNSRDPDVMACTFAMTMYRKEDFLSVQLALAQIFIWEFLLCPSGRLCFVRLEVYACL